MKLAVCVLPVVLCFVALPGVGQEAETATSAPTVAEVLQRHLEARGGDEALRAIERLEARGVLLAEGFEMPFVQWRMRPNRYRMNLEVQGTEIVQAYDGSNGWTIDPLSSGPKPVALEGDRLEVMAMQADFDGPLIAPDRKGIRVALGGTEQADGRELVRLEVTPREGGPMTIYLDAESMLEVKRTSSGVVGGERVQIESTYGGYREVAGVRFPATIEVATPRGTMTFRYDAYEVPAELDPEIFFMPGQEADPELTLAEILERHAAARSPAGAAAIRSVKATGTLGLMGLEVPLVMYFERPRRARLDADLQGLKMTLSYDGETAWTVSPMQGIPEPEALPEEAAEAIALFSDFLWGLLSPAEDGAAQKRWEVSFGGIEKVERDQTYRLDLAGADGQERVLYLGGEDFLERKLHLQAVFLGTDQVLDALLGDYRDVDGIQMPHRIEVFAGGNPAATVKVQQVETNVELEEGLFSMPARAAEPQQP